MRRTYFNRFFNGARQLLSCAHLRQTVCRFSRREARCSCQKTFCAPTSAVRQPTHSLPQGGRHELRRLAVVWMYGAGGAPTNGVGNCAWPERCRMKDGDVGGPWVITRAGGVSPLSFAYFSLRRQRKVGAAPHRGNAGKPDTRRGCQRKEPAKPRNSRLPKNQNRSRVADKKTTTL